MFTLKLFGLRDAIKYRSIHFAERITVFHVLTHDPAAAQTILPAGDALRSGPVVSGAEVWKMSGARVLWGARRSRPWRTPNTIALVVVLSRIVHDWDTLTFNALMD